jgi:hypothetical protein
MKLDHTKVRYVYFNSSYHARHHKEGLSCAACYAYPANTPFTKELAADAWAYLVSRFQGVQKLIDSGKEVYFLSHEAHAMIQENQGLYPKGAKLNFTDSIDPKCDDRHAVIIHDHIN